MEIFITFDKCNASLVYTYHLFNTLTYLKPLKAI